jgi:flagellar hook-associated protein 1 FlgK
MGVNSILDTARQAVLAQQAALQVVGQNIANVNTPGYTRERAVMVPAQSVFSGNVPGGGVAVDQVERVYDQFITAQLHVASAGYQAAREQADQMARVEVLFNDLGLQEGGLADSLERFFQSFQELANNPQGIPERLAVQEQGTVLVNAFHDLHAGLQSLNRDLNTTIEGELAEVNRIEDEIVDLSGQIQRTEVDPKNHANSLRDQRDELVKQLSEKIGITSFEASDGTFTVLLGSGRPLIEGTQSNPLIAVRDPEHPENLLVGLQDATGNVKDISANITSGKIRGLLDVRDTQLPNFVTRLDRLAAQLTSSVNQTHSNGFGLDASTGSDFFVPRQLSAQASSRNAGGGAVQSTAVFDPTQLTFDDYRLEFTANGPPPVFDIVNTTSGQTLATAQSYTSGAPIRFAGIEVIIKDASGTPQAGDTFHISTTQDAAQTIAVDTAILNDPERIAAAATPQAGDNANALLLADLRNAKVISGNTFGEFYSSLVSSVGLEKQNSTILAEHRELIVTGVENRRESLSGVSLDEEQVDLIRFQQAFAAAANFVRIADEMGQTILSLVR